MDACLRFQFHACKHPAALPIINDASFGINQGHRARYSCKPRAPLGQLANPPVSPPFRFTVPFLHLRPFILLSLPPMARNVLVGSIRPSIGPQRCSHLRLTVLICKRFFSVYFNMYILICQLFKTVKIADRTVPRWAWRQQNRNTLLARPRPPQDFNCSIPLITNQRLLWCDS